MHSGSRKTAAAGLVLVGLLASGSVLAQAAPGAKPRSSVGLAVVAQKSPYAGYDTDVLPVPVINWEGERFHFRGGSLGYTLISTGQTEVSLLASPYFMRFKRNDSDDPQMRQLSNRSMSAMAGVAVRHTAPWGVLQGNVQAEVSGHGGGFAADAKYTYPIPTGRVVLVPGVGAQYASSDLNDYYFGVSAVEAQRSGLAAYSAGSGVAPYMDFSAVMPLGPRWTATASLRRTLLSSAVKDSPMTVGSHMDSALLALSYAF
ncbi:MULTISPECIES: MipA/OmpV family protein [Stenotrophomonas]|uniref:MipA/OmpV family protein n=1 Tax=Stenotrophomonas TaxID=40323 RepID=UPI0008732002|nr:MULTISPECIES: MipA/OmpV family protein [Stenotrophomonas]OEZ00877.1 MltA-interacting MipA family protein [Stenotrophomonas sp. BIIR7]